MMNRNSSDDNNSGSRFATSSWSVGLGFIALGVLSIVVAQNIVAGAIYLFAGVTLVVYHEIKRHRSS